MARPVIFELPQEVLHYIFEFAIKEGDNDAVLVSNTSRRWYDIVTEHRGGNTRYKLSIRHFVKSIPLFFWARENGYIKLDMKIYRLAAREGCLGVVQWIRKNKPREGDFLAMREAIIGCHIEIVKWLRSKKCMWPPDACEQAVKNGHFELLRWLRSECCNWDGWLCLVEAASIGRIDIIEWLFEKRCGYDQWVVYYAAGNGHLETVKWLRGRGCPWNKTHCFDRAVRGGHNEVADWISRQPD